MSHPALFAAALAASTFVFALPAAAQTNYGLPDCGFAEPARVESHAPYHVMLTADGRTERAPVRPVRQVARFGLDRKDCRILIAVRIASWMTPAELRLTTDYADTLEDPLEFGQTHPKAQPSPVLNQLDSIEGVTSAEPDVVVFRVSWTAEDPPGRSLTYHLWQVRWALTDSERTRLAARQTTLETALRDLVDARAAVTVLETSAKTAARVVKALQDDLARVDAEAKLFAANGTAAGVQGLREKLAEAADIRTTLRAAQRAQESADDLLKVARTKVESVTVRLGARSGDVSGAEHELAAIKARLTAPVEPAHVALLRLGVLPLHHDDALAWYRFETFEVPPAPLGATLAQVSDYPRARQGQRGYAVVVDRAIAVHPYPFSLTLTRESGTPVTLASIRPTLAIPTPAALPAVADAVPAAGAAARFRDYRVRTLAAGGVVNLPEDVLKAVAADWTVAPGSRSTAFRDTVLPFGQPLQANQISVVSISTYVRKITKQEQVVTGEKTDSTTTIATLSETLIKDVKYPQVRPLYRFNYTTGALLTGLRNPTFKKVKTAADNTTTAAAGAVEALYRVDENSGSRRVLPMFLFSAYLKPVDIQERPWRSARSIPAPTIGFALNDPANNVFLGGTVEIYESIHLFAGRHWGTVRERIVNRDSSGIIVPVVNDEYDPADPPVQEVRRGSWTVGVSFNINLITTIFK